MVSSFSIGPHLTDSTSRYHLLHNFSLHNIFIIDFLYHKWIKINWYSVSNKKNIYIYILKINQIDFKKNTTQLILQTGKQNKVDKKNKSKINTTYFSSSMF
jgi:hypothetical protein